MSKQTRNATDAPKCWWIDHGSHGQITQRQEEADNAAAEGKKVVAYAAQFVARAQPITDDLLTDEDRFTNWCDRHEYDRAKRLDGTGYNSPATARAWSAWQAALAQSRRP